MKQFNSILITLLLFTCQCIVTKSITLKPGDLKKGKKSALIGLKERKSQPVQLIKLPINKNFEEAYSSQGSSSISDRSVASERNGNFFRSNSVGSQNNQRNSPRNDIINAENFSSGIAAALNRRRSSSISDRSVASERNGNFFRSNSMDSQKTARRYPRNDIINPEEFSRGLAADLNTQTKLRGLALLDSMIKYKLSHRQEIQKDTPFTDSQNLDDYSRKLRVSARQKKSLKDWISELFNSYGKYKNSQFLNLFYDQFSESPDTKAKNIVIISGDDLSMINPFLNYIEDLGNSIRRDFNFIICPSSISMINAFLYALSKQINILLVLSDNTMDTKRADEVEELNKFYKAWKGEPESKKVDTIIESTGEVINEESLKIEGFKALDIMGAFDREILKKSYLVSEAQQQEIESKLKDYPIINYLHKRDSRVKEVILKFLKKDSKIDNHVMGPTLIKQSNNMADFLKTKP